MPLGHLEKLRQIQADKQSVLCVGLDPDLDKLPASVRAGREPDQAILAFSRSIVEATASFACAFKLNVAFFEVLGWRGWKVLEEVIRTIPDDCIIIADAKRGDIGNSTRFYAQTFFETLGCDACTVAPYMGRDSVEPFLQYEGKAAYVLARTSNPGAADFQECDCGGEKLYLKAARKITSWGEGTRGTAGLVVGATDAASLAEVRRACPTAPFLIPGVGAQGGSAQEVIQAALTPEGPILVNSSRQVLYASSGENFAEAAAEQAAALRNDCRGNNGPGRSKDGGHL